MTPQKLFDDIVTFQRKQGEKSIKLVGKITRLCMYRHPDGLRCAVGCVLPDKLYKEKMEKESVETLFQGFPEVENYFGSENKYLLSDMQRVHDSSDVPYWEEKWAEVASTHNLIYTAPGEE